MGVPKFYRWVSERYPCLSEVVKEFQIPEFDNLYLDMNGIIHVCSHPEDDNPHFRITEEKIFKDIMHYLEFLFRMIKPRKVFFMAVDGVAPRAKMNQQRGRRFRSAREAEELEKKAKAKGETLPTEKRFDSNCITPGTPFMVRLQEQLKYFVVKKLSSDPLWHGVRVYLSGHETPGEGEHKIMDFIRSEKCKPDYDPNTRHCLHGLDADLMMLGLATHEPHFSLLREEVRFGGRKDRNKRPATPEETTFHLLHLSLFREYLDFEFSALKTKLPFTYDLENIIDDWVLMGFLVGNDFIPHLPNLHINHDALPLLWQTYMEVLPTCTGYINEGGYLNLERFEAYLTALSKFDFDTFSEQVGDLKWLEGKKADATVEKQEMLSAARKFRKNAKKAENHFAALLDLPTDDMDGFLGLEGTDGSADELSEENILSDEDSEDTLDDEFRHHKRAYYMNKLEYEKVTPEVLKDQAEGYVRGIQWILLYYYEGVPSWSWFYPHHYAPYMSDVKDFKHMDIKYDLNTPFKPFEQLMAVLPAASKELLPQPYQSLMTMASSPVIDFYPVDFSTDLNGKQQDWEAVVLIPFIDENRLLTAMRAAEVDLTPEERKRNSHGPCWLYNYTEEPLETYPSSLPGSFPDIVMNHARVTQIPKEEFWLKPGQFKKGLLKGAKLDVFFPGFPTLKHIPHKSELRKDGVKVFQMNSRGYNVMLEILGKEEKPDIQTVAKEYLGKEIYVGWPHLYEAKVIAVCNPQVSHSLVEVAPVKGSKGPQSAKIRVDRCDDNTASIWYKEINNIADRYKDRLGVLVGDTDILLRALPMTGRKYIFGSHGRITMSKQFGNQPVPFALQATVKDIAVHDPNFCQFKTLKEYLPESQPVFMLGWPHYACQGEVIEVDGDSGRVRVNLSIFEEPKVSGIMSNQQLHDERYMPGYIAAQRLGISSQLYGRLTGTILVCQGEADLAREQQNPHKVNIGLNLKFTKRGEEVPGFTRLKDGQWSYAEKTVEIAREYMAKFPQMWDTISKSERSHNDIFYESDIISKNSNHDLKAVSEYLKTLSCYGLKSTKSGADIISEGVIKALETEADKVVDINKKRQKRVKMLVKPHLLFRPLRTSGALIPDSTTSYSLFDRVVNIRQGYSVPFGLRGTVVGIHPSEVEVNSVFEVLFDEEFLGGISIRNSSPRGYRMPPSSLLNLTHGERKNGVKPTVSVQPSAQASGSHGNQQHWNANKDFNNTAAGHSGYQRNTGGYQGQQGDRYARQGYQNQSRGGHQDNFHSPWGRNQSEWSRQNQVANQRPGDNQYGQKKEEKPSRKEEDLSGQVFNGSTAGSSQPKFVTPKVNPGTQRRLSQGENQQSSKSQTSAQQSSAGNSEFENMWKQLQSSMPASPPETGKPDISSLPLTKAAAVLPSVITTTTDNTNNSNTEQESRKIDVLSLFTEASKASISDEDIKPAPSKPKKKTSKVVTNDEFAAMFKSLSAVEISSDDEEKKVEQEEPEDGSEMIKKMLNINSEEMGTGEVSTEPLSQPNRSYGRQVSIQELFEGAKKQQEQEIVDSGPNQQTKNPPQAQKKDNSNQGNQKSRQQQGSQGQHMNQQQAYQNQNRPSMLAQPNKGGTRNPVMELMSFCQSLQLGLPFYDYNCKNGQHYCVVTLFNGQRFSGSMCKTREEAAESAAGVALLQLKGGMGLMQGHPMMQMPYGQRGILAQNQQFSSPNSAFSPVSNIAEAYQGPGQYGHGRFNNPQQRPQYGHPGYQSYNRGGNKSGSYGNQGGNYGNQGGGYGSQSGGYGNPGGNFGNQSGYHGNKGGSQQYQFNQSSGKQQYSESSNPSQSVYNTKEEGVKKSEGTKNTEQGDVKPQPKAQNTCIVNPFVPLQVTKKQTPQKNRKESISDDAPTKPEKSPQEKISDIRLPEPPVTTTPSKVESELSPNTRHSNTQPQNSNDISNSVQVKTTPKQEPVTPSAQKTDSSEKPQPTPASGKKSRRRLAANFSNLQ